MMFARDDGVRGVRVVRVLAHADGVAAAAHVRMRERHDVLRAVHDDRDDAGGTRTRPRPPSPIALG